MSVEASNCLCDQKTHNDHVGRVTDSSKPKGQSLNVSEHKLRTFPL